MAQTIVAVTDLSYSHRIDVVQAYAQIRHRVLRTPLLSNPSMDAELGVRLFVKAEVLQRTGSFKLRGAMNRISQMTPEERSRGVVAFSSGNHAQAVAYAARMFEMPAVIVMPKDAPAMKIQNTRSYGAEVVLYDRYTEDREAMGRDISSRRGLTLIPPFDDELVIAGQGTVALEMIEQAAEIDARFDMIVIPCSGGGLTAGCALACASRSPSTAIYLVEPAGFDDTRRSLVSGKRETNTDDRARTLCDALMANSPGKITFEINRELVKGAIAVTDQEALEAMRHAFCNFKIVVEPGGAVALAAVLNKKIAVEGKTVGIVCSGGNVDPAIFATHCG